MSPSSHIFFYLLFHFLLLPYLFYSLFLGKVALFSLERGFCFYQIFCNGLLHGATHDTGDALKKKKSPCRNPWSRPEVLCRFTGRLFKRRRTEASRNCTRELGGEEGPGRNAAALLLFVKAKYSPGSNLWLTPGFTPPVATTEPRYRIYDKSPAPRHHVSLSHCLLVSQLHKELQASGILGGLLGPQPAAARSCPAAGSTRTGSCSGRVSLVV